MYINGLMRRHLNTIIVVHIVGKDIIDMESNMLEKVGGMKRQKQQKYTLIEITWIGAHQIFGVPLIKNRRIKWNI